jgi:hypothetical protein
MKLLEFAVLIVALAAAAPAHGQETAGVLVSQPKGWVDLFPSADFKGWTRLSIPADKPLSEPNQWKVDAAGGLLVCDGTGGHDWLRYDRELADFIFHVEWRFVPKEGGKGYNSGVFVRNSADGAIWHQAQVGIASGGFIFGDALVGGKTQRINLRPQMTSMRVKPAGEWNTYEVTAKGRTLSVWVNGAVTSEFTGCEVPRGYIGLEAEGWLIEFRNIKLKEMK